MATSPLTSELVFHLVDDSTPKPATAELRVPVAPFDITDATLLPYQVSAGQVLDLLGGNTDSYLSQLGLAKCTLVIDIGTDPKAALNGSDPRLIWEMSCDTNTDLFRFAIPGRNQRNALVAGGTKGQIANLSAAAWVAFINAFNGTGGSAQLTNPVSGSAGAIGGGRGTVRPRARPRVG